MPKAYISIDEVYPVFNLTADKASSVHIDVPKEQLKTWKAVFKQYASVQRQIETLVNHYEPACLKEAIAKQKRKP